MQEVHFIIEGRVQRVGFRRYVLRQAELYQVFGWTRNNADGTVEVFATGPVDRLSLFIAACRKGPLFAHVTDLKFVDIDNASQLLLSPGRFYVVH